VLRLSDEFADGGASRILKWGALAGLRPRPSGVKGQGPWSRVRSKTSRKTGSRSCRVPEGERFCLFVYLRLILRKLIFFHTQKGILRGGWLSSIALMSINEVIGHWARLVVRWVTVCWRVNHLVF